MRKDLSFSTYIFIFFDSAHDRKFSFTASTNALIAVFISASFESLPSVGSRFSSCSFETSSKEPRISVKLKTKLSFSWSDIVEGELASGNSVRIDGLGTLRPVLGLVGKELRGEWTDSANRLTTGRNVRLKTVNFRPDSGLLRGIGRDMTLERASNRLGRKRPSTTVEERAAMARQYLSEHGFMRVADYAALTGLARTTAANELRRLAEDETSGITSVGARAGKVYVNR